MENSRKKDRKKGWKENTKEKEKRRNSWRRPDNNNNKILIISNHNFNSSTQREGYESENRGEKGQLFSRRSITHFLPLGTGERSRKKRREGR